MSESKRRIELSDERDGIARGIIIRVGIWAPCGRGCGDLINTYSAEPANAYAYASTLWKNKAASIALFDTRKQLMDTIKYVLETQDVYESRTCSCNRIWRDNM